MAAGTTAMHRLTRPCHVRRCVWAAEVVEHHDVAGLERWHERHLDERGEVVTVDRAVDDISAADAPVIQGRDQGGVFLMSVAGFFDQALTARAASTSSRPSTFTSLGNAVIPLLFTSVASPIHETTTHLPQVQSLRTAIAGSPYVS